MQHQEYPKFMSHPAFEPGRVGDLVTSPDGFTYHVGGTPIRFPPVMVNGEDDEAYYAAKGYVSQSQSDPGAFMRAHSVAPATANYQPAEYPKWVGEVLVNNEEQELAILELSPIAEESKKFTEEAVGEISQMGRDGEAMRRQANEKIGVYRGQETRRRNAMERS